MKNHAYTICAVLFVLFTIRVEALQITFPVEAGEGVKRVGEKDRTLKNYFDKFQVTYNGEAYRYGTYGDRSRAFRPDNTSFQNFLGLTVSEKLRNGVEWESRITLRHSNDPVITNRDDFHFTSFYATAGKADKWNIRVGDLYPNLSRYSFNRFAEGAQAGYTHDVSDAFRLKLEGVVGQTQRARENATLQRAALGGAITWQAKRQVNNRPIWELGWRHGYAADKLGSVDVHGNLADLHEGVHAVVYNASLPSGWRLEGENAWSRGAANRKTNPTDRRGYAWLTNLTWIKPRTTPAYEGISRFRPVAFQFNWELVDPYFLTALGVAAADQRRWSARSSHSWNQYLNWDFSHLRLEDNVRDQAILTNVSQTTTFSADATPFKLFDQNYSSWILKLPESVQDVKSRFEFRYNDRDATNGTVNSKIEDYIYSLTYVNWGTTFVGDYSFQITDDDVTPANERRVQAWGVQASRPFHYRAYDVRLFPRVSYRYSRDRFRITGTATRLQTTNFSLGVNWEELSGNFGYVITDSNRDPQGNDYLQYRWTNSITYRPYLFPTLQVTLAYNSTVFDDETSSRDYEQTETRASVRYSF